jgi:ENTH domain
MGKVVSCYNTLSFMFASLKFAFVLSNFLSNFFACSFNQAKPKTELEAKVYEVLSHKNWGASSTVMNDIARDTYDQDKFIVITQLMWENMENQRPAAWRVVFKGLTLLEHLIKNGSERCVDDARNHGHSLRALHQFNYYEGTIDRGLGVREKSKQLIEILGDDERIREERQKARKLREKFGGNQGGGVSSANKYSGYGNDNWNSGGGYGDGGIGSERHDNNNDNRGYSGRYDDEGTRSQPRAPEPAPTFAALPDEQPKKSKLKKKKKKDEPIEPTVEASVDLFLFDTPSLAEDEFDSFQSGDVLSSSDPFAAPTISNQHTVSFDAFGTSASQPHQGNSRDSFAVSTLQQPHQHNEFVGITEPFGNAFPSQNTMSTLNIQSPTNFLPSVSKQNQKQLMEDDEFGDFAAATSSASKTNSNVDPLSKLISLDGLSKNSNKSNKEAKLNEPIIANPAAAAFVSEKDQIQAYIKMGAGGSSMSFQGIDGLHKPVTGFGGGLIPASGGFSSNVMTPGAGGNLDVISSLDPAIMASQRSQPTYSSSGTLYQGTTGVGFSGMPQQFSMQGSMAGYNNGSQVSIGGNATGHVMSGMPGGTHMVAGGMHGIPGGTTGSHGGVSGFHAGMPGMMGSVTSGTFGQMNGSGGYSNMQNFANVQGISMQTNTGMQGTVAPTMGYQTPSAGPNGPYSMNGQAMGFR